MSAIFFMRDRIHDETDFASDFRKPFENVVHKAPSCLSVKGKCVSAIMLLSKYSFEDLTYHYEAFCALHKKNVSFGCSLKTSLPFSSQKIVKTMRSTTVDLLDILKLYNSTQRTTLVLSCVKNDAIDSFDFGYRFLTINSINCRWVDN